MGDQEDLLAAVRANDPDRVRRVLGRNPFIRRLGTAEGTVLLTAKHAGAEAALGALLEHVQEDELNLYEASALGRAGRLKTILGQSRRRVNEPGVDGHTPLGLAAAFGQPDAVKVLLDHGADPGVATKAGVTPLAVALAAGHADVAELLRSRGAKA